MGPLSLAEQEQLKDRLTVTGTGDDEAATGNLDVRYVG